MLIIGFCFPGEGRKGEELKNCPIDNRERKVKGSGNIEK